MAQFILTTQTPVAVGSAIPYNDVVEKGCGCIRHRKGSGIIKVKGGTYCRPNRYLVAFHGNVTGVTGLIQLGIYLDGELLPETVMNINVTGPTVVQSADTTTEILADCGCQTISVRNIAGTGLEMVTASLIVNRG